MKKVVFIVGPTAVGKTNLGLKIAKHFKGSIISADSVQVYKDLDIVSGKDIPKGSKFSLLPQFTKDGLHSGYYTFDNIRIFLLDVVAPSFSFAVSHFSDLASKYVQYTGHMNMMPIVVGGTGLYIKALIEGINIGVKPDLELRKKLEKLNVEALQSQLKKINLIKFESMNNSDISNSRRLVRAIEITTSKLHNNHSISFVNRKSLIINHNYDSLVIGLYCDREILKKKIDKRVEHRLENGALGEVEGLFENYKILAPQVKDANGYKQLFEYLLGKLSLEEAVERWKIAEYKHAKNQMTWFKKDSRILWLEATREDLFEAVKWEIDIFLSA